MYKITLAVIAAAVFAGIIVGIAPKPAPAVAGTAPSAQPHVLITEPASTTVAPAADARCTQAWPYYEQSCLHDSLVNGKARVVRVVTTDKSVAGRASQARR